MSETTDLAKLRIEAADAEFYRLSSGYEKIDVISKDPYEISQGWLELSCTVSTVPNDGSEKFPTASDWTYYALFRDGTAEVVESGFYGN